MKKIIVILLSLFLLGCSTSKTSKSIPQMASTHRYDCNKDRYVHFSKSKHIKIQKPLTLKQTLLY